MSSRFFVGLLCIGASAALLAQSGSLDIYWLDSEGGGSTLIITPAGESVLIDSGNAGGRDPERIRHAVVEVAHLDHIDHCITTHFHSDHMGGAPELSRLLPIRHLWDNGLPETDPDGNLASPWPLISKAYRSMSVGERHRVLPGTVIPLQGEALQLACVIARQKVWANPPWHPQPNRWARGEDKVLKDRDSSDNANSSAWVLTWGNFRFYDGGDLTWNTELSLTYTNILVPEVDIYQVTHHGLDVSNHPWLLKCLNPTVSVMNNGSTKGTAGEVIGNLRKLEGLRAQYQIHKNIRSNEGGNNCADDHIANLTADCAGNYIHAHVVNGGDAYTIEIPANGHRASYVTRKKAF